MCENELLWFEVLVSKYGEWRGLEGALSDHSTSLWWRGLVDESGARKLTKGGIVIDPLLEKCWNLLVPPKIQCFVWRVLRNRLPTCDNLLKRKKFGTVAGCVEQLSVGIWNYRNNIIFRGKAFCQEEIVYQARYHSWQWI
ncbi:hypothetical protein JHK87_004873 [Glycine soja]|nr:hypothetical protein JHK87_004873 [Glycine soja]